MSLSVWALGGVCACSYLAGLGDVGLLAFGCLLVLIGSGPAAAARRPPAKTVVQGEERQVML